MLLYTLFDFNYSSLKEIIIGYYCSVCVTSLYLTAVVTG